MKVTVDLEWFKQLQTWADDLSRNSRALADLCEKVITDVEQPEKLDNE